MHRCATGSINATFARKDFYAQLEWMMSVVSGNYSESQGFILTYVNSCFISMKDKTSVYGILWWVAWGVTNISTQEQNWCPDLLRILSDSGDKWDFYNPKCSDQYAEWPLSTYHILYYYYWCVLQCKDFNVAVEKWDIWAYTLIYQPLFMVHTSIFYFSCLLHSSFICIHVYTVVVDYAAVLLL